jgi:hypothetical protein
MLKEPLNIRSRRAFGLIEAVLATATLLIFASIFAGAFVYGTQSLREAEDSHRAALLAEEALLAVRNIRDQDFSLLQTGDFGVVLSDGVWALQQDMDESNGFTRTVHIDFLNASSVQVSARVSWGPENETRDINLVTILSDWKPF